MVIGLITMRYALCRIHVRVPHSNSAWIWTLPDFHDSHGIMVKSIYISPETQTPEGPRLLQNWVLMANGSYHPISFVLRYYQL